MNFNCFMNVLCFQESVLKKLEKQTLEKEINWQGIVEKLNTELDQLRNHGTQASE